MSSQLSVVQLNASGKVVVVVLATLHLLALETVARQFSNSV